MLRSEWESMQGLAQHLPADAREQLGGCVELIDDALEGVDRAVTIVREVNEFSRGQGDGKSEADVNELLEDAVRMASPHMSDAIRLERAFGELPALCCSVVRMHDGAISVRSEPGSGTSFELRLPLAVPAGAWVARPSSLVWGSKRDL